MFQHTVNIKALRSSFHVKSLKFGLYLSHSQLFSFQFSHVSHALQPVCVWGGSLCVGWPKSKDRLRGCSLWNSVDWRFLNISHVPMHFICTVLFTHKYPADEELDPGWLAGLGAQQDLYSGLVVPPSRLLHVCGCLECKKLSRVMMAKPYCWTASWQGP